VRPENEPAENSDPFYGEAVCPKRKRDNPPAERNGTFRWEIIFANDLDQMAFDFETKCEKVGGSSAMEALDQRRY